MDKGPLAEALAALRDLEGRVAAQQALLDDRLLRVENNRLFRIWNSMVARAMRWRRRIKRASPRDEKCQTQAYAKWIAHEQSRLPHIGQARVNIDSWKFRPTISFVAAAPAEQLRSGLSTQIYANWEVSEAPSLNAALRLARGEYIALLTAPGSLSPYALYYAVEALQNASADLLYTDEDHMAPDGRRMHPVLKPAWSPDLLRSCMYAGHFLLIRRESFLQSGGLREDCGSAALHDLILRMARAPLQVCHVPRVLYHRSGKSDPAFMPQTEPEPPTLTAVVCSRSPDLLRRCLQSINRTAAGVIRGIVVVAHEEDGVNEPLRSVIREYGATAVPFTGAFDFASMNNSAAALVSTPGLLFLNDDVYATGPGWAETLASHLAYEGTGIAGAILRYPEGDLQHAGIVAGIRDGVAHAGRHVSASTLWPWLLKTRNVSAVTGACLAIRTELFRELGGFDPEFPNNYNDVDLCFRAQSLGYRVVCAAAEGLIHAECQTRPGIVRFEERYKFFRRWARILSRPDPYYSPALAPTEEIALNLTNDQGIRPLLSGSADALFEPRFAGNEGSAY